MGVGWREVPSFWFYWFGVRDPTAFHGIGYDLGGLLDEDPVFLGDDGAFVVCDGAGFGCVTKAAGVPWLEVAWCFHLGCMVLISARTQLQ